MKALITCSFGIAIYLGGLVNAPARLTLQALPRASQSQDSSLLKPSDIAYTDAVEFARFLSDKGINVKSMHRSKMESFFKGLNKAAFFRTDKGIAEVIFFPDPAGAEKVRVTERREAGHLIYSFNGQPNPRPGDKINAGRPVYFIMHGKFFIVTNDKELYDALASGIAGS